MGFFETFGAGLGAIQEQRAQDQNTTQQLLLQLVAQNPALAETPEIQAALGEAFPNRRFAGVSDALGSLNEIRLAEEGRLRGIKEEEQADERLWGVGLAGAQNAIPITADDPEAALGELAVGVGGKARTARTQALMDALMEHRRAMELQELKNRDSSSATAQLSAAMSGLGAGLLQALDKGDDVTYMPDAAPGARTAADQEIELITEQWKQRMYGLAQVSRLHRSLGQDSPGPKQLWMLFNQAPGELEKEYGSDWKNAKDYVAANMTADEGMLLSELGSDPGIRLLAEGISEQYRLYVNSKSKETVSPRPNEAAFDVVNRAAEASGRPAPFPDYSTVEEKGEVVFPGEGEVTYTQPEITFEQLDPKIQALYMQGQNINGLNAMYSTILQVHGLDMDAAYQDMIDLRDEMIKAGYLDPTYGGQ